MSDEMLTLTVDEIRTMLREAKREAWVQGTKARRDYRGDLVELNPYGRGGAR